MPITSIARDAANGSPAASTAGKATASGTTFGPKRENMKEAPTAAVSAKPLGWNCSRLQGGKVGAATVGKLVRTTDTSTPLPHLARPGLMRLLKWSTRSGLRPSTMVRAAMGRRWHGAVPELVSGARRSPGTSKCRGPAAAPTVTVAAALPPQPPSSLLLLLLLLLLPSLLLLSLLPLSSVAQARSSPRPSARAHCAVSKRGASP